MVENESIRYSFWFSADVDWNTVDVVHNVFGGRQVGFGRLEFHVHQRLFGNMLGMAFERAHTTKPTEVVNYVTYSTRA